MIPVNEWTTHGVWGDLNTPVGVETLVPLVGRWDSYLLDLSEGVKVLEHDVTSAYVLWDAVLPEKMTVFCDARVNDTGEWQKGLGQRDHIERAPELNAARPPTMRIRVRMYSEVGDVIPLEDTAVTAVYVVLARKRLTRWSPPGEKRLEWRPHF